MDFESGDMDVKQLHIHPGPTLPNLAVFTDSTAIIIPTSEDCDEDKNRIACKLLTLSANYSCICLN